MSTLDTQKEFRSFPNMSRPLQQNLLLPGHMRQRYCSPTTPPVEELRVMELSR